MKSVVTRKMFAPIVEGHGEVYAVPDLLRRLGQAVAMAVTVNPPIRIASGSFMNDRTYFHRYVTLAASKAAQGNGAVLILLDCDDNCPATIGPDLLARARAVRSDVPYIVALAKKEYENWFLAAARSLRGQHGLPADLEPPPDIEGIRDAKGWLRERMGEPYDPITHQRLFTRGFDLTEAQSSQSFARLFRRITEFILAS